MTEISIIIPNYNQQEYVDSCLNSIFSGGFLNELVEVVIVDDASTDHSLDKITQFISSHSDENINLIKLNKHYPTGKVREIGISNSEGKFIFFLDMDDMIIPETIVHMYHHLKNSSEEVMFCDTRDLTETGSQEQSIYSYLNCFNLPSTSLEHGTKELYPTICFGGVCWRYLLRKEFILKNNIHFYNASMGEDIYFTNQVYMHMTSFGVVPEVGVIHRIYSGSTPHCSLEDVKEFTKIFQEIFITLNYQSEVLVLEFLCIFIPKMMSMLDFSLSQFTSIFGELISKMLDDTNVKLFPFYTIFYQSVLKGDEIQFNKFKKIFIS